MGLLALGSCGQPTGRNGANASAERAGMPETTSAQLAESLPDRVEVLSFHTRRRCPTCRAIERLTREVVAGTFAHQVADSSLVLRVVEIEREEALAVRYGVAWSSLLLHGRRDGADTVVNLTRPAFDNARTNPEEFRALLTREIEKLLEL